MSTSISAPKPALPKSTTPRFNNHRLSPQSDSALDAQQEKARKAGRRVPSKRELIEDAIVGFYCAPKKRHKETGRALAKVG